MVEPSELDKKPDREKDNLKKEHQVALGIIFQLVRYMPTGASLWIFGSFIKNQDWLSAVISFPIMVLMLAWSIYSQGFLIKIQERAKSLIQQVQTCLSRSTRELVSSLKKLNLLNFCTTNPNVKTPDLSGADLNGIDLSGVDLSGANLKYANLRYANLSGTNLNCAELRYADLTGADLRYANLNEANLKRANLSDANLNCTLLNGANLSDANLRGALLFFTNLREVLNLEPLQLKAKPSPFLCNVALPSYFQRLDLNPNRACGLIPQLLSDRYKISLEEAQWIVDEARQHQWNSR